MFKQQLEIFNQPSERQDEAEAALTGKFSPDILTAVRSALEDKLGLKGQNDFAQVLAEFKKRNDCLDAYDLVVATSRYKKVSGTSDDRAAQRHAEKVVAHEMARLAHELGLAIFQPAYPKLKETPAKTEEKPGAEAAAGEHHDKNHESSKRAGTYLSRSHNEEDERK
jgi:hypothetical protein